MSHLSGMALLRNIPTILLITAWLSTRSLWALVPTNATSVHLPSPTTGIAAVGAETSPGAASVREATAGTTNAPPAPFKAIAVRNAFGIKEPVPPPPFVEPPPPRTQPPPNVFLTGFSSWKGVQKVYLQVARPGTKAPDYLDLSVGDAQFGIKVLEIDEREESAKILNDGQEVVLNFKENGLKPGGGPVPSGIHSGIPGPVTTAVNTGIINSRTAYQPPGHGAPAPNGGGPTVIGRGGVTQSQGANVYAAGFPEGDPRSMTMNREIPARRGGSAAAVQPYPDQRIVHPNETRIIQGRVIPPPPPLPVDLNTFPGN